MHFLPRLYAFFAVKDAKRLELILKITHVPVLNEPRQRICVFEHSVMTNFNCACPATKNNTCTSTKWAPSSEFVSSSIPSWQILTAHAQPFRGARDLAFCLKVPLDSLLVWASSEGSGETARMHRLAWTFAARIGDKYQIRLTRSKYCSNTMIV